MGGWEGGLRGLAARRPVLMGWGGALGGLGAGGAQGVGMGGDGGRPEVGGCRKRLTAWPRVSHGKQRSRDPKTQDRR